MAFEDGLRKLEAAGIEFTRGDAAFCELRGVREVVRFRSPTAHREAETAKAHRG